MTKIDTLRKINKNIVHEDGTITSFDKQLIQLMSGIYDTRYPLIVADSTHSLDYIEDFATDNPLVMNVSTVIKLREKHDIGYEFVSNCEMYLKESVLAFDSYQHDTSKIILLDEVDDDGFPMIAICRENKDMGGNLLLNEITSIYEKEKLEQLLNRSYENDKTFYTNKKTEQYVKSRGLQLSKGLTYALSNYYTRASFNKSQVEQDLAKEKGCIEETYGMDLEEDLQEKIPEVYGNDKVQELIKLVIDKHYKKVENDEIVYDDDLLLELYDMVPEMSFNEIDEYGMCLSNEMQMMIDGSYQHEYMMLGRLQQDCEYYLGYGQRSERNLWADTVQDHIHAMKRYYNQVPIKPEWLSYKDILRYEAKMTTLKSLDDLRDLLEAHDWKIYDGGTSWEIEQYSPAGEDFVFCIQHDKSLEKAVEQICEYAMNFDQEEHIAMWLEARTVDDNRMNVPSPSELVEDAKEIQGMLDELDYVLDNCTLMEKKKKQI